MRGGCHGPLQYATTFYCPSIPTVISTPPNSIAIYYKSNLTRILFGIIFLPYLQSLFYPCIQTLQITFLKHSYFITTPHLSHYVFNLQELFCQPPSIRAIQRDDQYIRLITAYLFTTIQNSLFSLQTQISAKNQLHEIL